jgi:hypothetical protein
MRAVSLAFVVVPLVLLGGDRARAQGPQDPPQPRDVPIVSCESKAGERRACPADTSQGVALVRSRGSAACLLGKTWGYDDEGVWVADGCSGDFLAGPVPAGATPQKKKSPEYVPNAGFLLYEGQNGQIYMRLFSYARYLNQKGLDASYTDSFGNTFTVKQREDIQLNKFFLPFSGWFLSPKFRYYLYVWSSNPSQGDPAQVVGAGNLSYSFNRFVTLGGGITSLPSTRSTEGQFPYWLGVDDRLTTKFKYMAMLGNNLSTLGVSAAQLDTSLNTTSVMLQWLPTTGEFGLYGTFGDYDWHEKLATRVALHGTHSREDKQSQPGTNSIENSQIRLTDGSIVFTPDLFGTGISVDKVTYDMVSLDAGAKYKGFSLEAEYYWRWLSDFTGPGADAIADVDDDGFQVQASAMAIRDVLQPYLGYAEIRGSFGDSAEFRAGGNWYPFAKRGVRVNVEWLHLDDCPVGYTAVPYPVGGNGDVYHLNVEMNF